MPGTEQMQEVRASWIYMESFQPQRMFPIAEISNISADYNEGEEQKCTNTQIVRSVTFTDTSSSQCTMR